MNREAQALHDSFIPKYAQLIYNGFWFAPEREALQALITSTQRTVSGKVRLKIYKGNCLQAGRKSDLSLYDEDVASMEGATEGKEEAYDQNDASKRMLSRCNKLSKPPIYFHTT